MATAIEEVRDEIIQHFKDNPTHGYNCACLDEQLRKVKQAMRVSEYWGHEEDAATDKAMNAVEYVFYSAAKGVHRWQKSKKEYL